MPAHSRRLASSIGSVDDAAVEQMDAAVGVARVARIVRDHADRRAALMQLVAAAPSPLRRSSNRGCRSARRRAGSAARRRPRARRRRAAAGRRRAGCGRCFARCAMPTRSSASVTRSRRSAGRMPAVGERQLDVLEHGQIADQVEALEDEADLAVADARALRTRSARRPARPLSAVRRRRVGESSRPRIESSVDLPQPDGPAIETYSPSGDLEIDVGQRVRFDFVGRRRPS